MFDVNRPGKLTVLKVAAVLGPVVAYVMQLVSQDPSTSLAVQLLAGAVGAVALGCGTAVLLNLPSGGLPNRRAPDGDTFSSKAMPHIATGRPRLHPF